MSRPWVVNTGKAHIFVFWFATISVSYLFQLYDKIIDTKKILYICQYQISNVCLDNICIYTYTRKCYLNSAHNYKTYNYEFFFKFYIVKP